MMIVTFDTRTATRNYTIIVALLVFVAVPLIYYAAADYPRRTLLKESLTLITILAYSLMVGQFYFTRSNKMIEVFNKRNVLTVHKYVAYSIVTIFLTHPFLIVLPRFFEAGISPWDAFVEMLITFESTGIILGMIAWVLMLILTVISYTRIELFVKKLGTKYRVWRMIHGILTLVIIFLATWHAADLGRLTDRTLSVFFIVLATTGSALLLREYLSKPEEQPEKAK